MPSRSISRNELAAARAEVALRVGPLRVDARPVVPGPDRAQALRIRAFQVAERHERVGALEAQDVADAVASPRAAGRSR